MTRSQTQNRPASPRIAAALTALVPDIAERDVFVCGPEGWAAERAAAALRELDDTDFCLSAGGDLVCRATRPGSAPWRIGIEDPHDPSRVVAVIPVRAGAVATSGTAHRGRHLVDARTGRDPESVASVTVVADSLTWADIDATAAYALGSRAATWLRARPGRTALVVWRDGTRTVVGDDA